MRIAVALLSSLLLLGACEKSDGGTKGKAPDPQGVVGKDGIRRVHVEAGRTGYKPDKIPAKPGETLILVVTQTAKGECFRQIKVGDGPLVDLKMNEPVEVSVTIPASGGDVRFACGMDMLTGVIAVN
jgi:plastocyanin domain-containing protein